MALLGSRINTEVTNSSVRLPAVSGRFYPAQAEHLRTSIRTYCDAVADRTFGGMIRAVIAPHAGYIFSGPTAAHSFKALDLHPDNRHTVYLLGPAHYVHVSGVALGYYSAFETPLGKVCVDKAVVESLAEHPLFDMQNDAHNHEHCLEVELPFLQVRACPDLYIVPMLSRDADPLQVAKALRPHLQQDSHARVIISSDLSHFHTYADASRTDSDFLNAVVKGDFVAVARGEACGREAILALMHLAEDLSWQPHLLDYRNSGDTGGDRDSVVGYGAVAFTETP